MTTGAHQLSTTGAHQLEGADARGPSGWRPAEAQSIELGSRDAASGYRHACWPGSGAQRRHSCRDASTGPGQDGQDLGAAPLVPASARDRQGRLAPEVLADLNQGLAGNGGPGPTADRRRKDQPARWLTASMLALGVLAAAAAAVSYSAQYRMVLAAKAVAPVAALEAGIPDVAALIFATLGIALALHGKRAIRARALNVGAVATSITMNVLAAGHGWRDLAIWAMPPVAYALASDTRSAFLSGS